MLKLRPHQLEDPEALAELMRQAVRRDDRTTLEQIARPLSAFAKRAFLARYVTQRLAGLEASPESWFDTDEAQARTDLARHLVTVSRAMAGVAGPAHLLDSETSWPVELYIRSLRVAMPEVWFGWLGRYPAFVRIIERGGDPQQCTELRTRLVRHPAGPSTLPEHAVLVVQRSGALEVRTLSGADLPQLTPERACVYLARSLPTLEPEALEPFSLDHLVAAANRITDPELHTPSAAARPALYPRIDGIAAAGRRSQPRRPWSLSLSGPRRLVQHLRLTTRAGAASVGVSAAVAVGVGFGMAELARVHTPWLVTEAFAAGVLLVFAAASFVALQWERS